MSCEIFWSLSAKRNKRPIPSEEKIDFIFDSLRETNNLLIRRQSQWPEDDWIGEFTTYSNYGAEDVPEVLQDLAKQNPDLAFKLYGHCYDSDWEVIFLIDASGMETLLGKTVFPEPVKIHY